MGKALWILLFASALCPCEAQTSWGKIKFSNRQIPTLAGDATYNFPIYAPYNVLWADAGAGSMPGGATVALFRQTDLPDGAPIASVRLRTDTPQNAAFFAESPIVEVPGAFPGATTTLVIRAWAGPSFNDTAYRGEWAFTTQPLGGIRPSDGAEISTPGMTGWGLGGEWDQLGPLSIWPWPRITAPTIQSVFSASQQITIHSEVVMESNMGEVVLTNLTLLANDTVLRRQDAPTSPTLTASVSLAPGQYRLRLVSSGYFRRGSETSPYGPHTSAPVNVTIVASWGTINFANRSIPTAAGDATYNVPIWAFGSATVGAGSLPGGATVALFRRNDLPDGPPLASVKLRTDTPANSAFFATPVQTVEVPGALPGATTTLVIRAWTSPSIYEGQGGEWSFTTQPLGGIRPSDGVEIATPGLTGWGPGVDNGGYQLYDFLLTPLPRITAPAKQRVFAPFEQINIRSEVVMESSSYFGEFVLTNLTLLANDTVLRSQDSPTSPNLNASVYLAPGTYSLRLAAKGYFKSGAMYGRRESEPVNITVVDAALSTPQVWDVWNGQVSFYYTVNPGIKYVVKTSSDLFVWQSIATNTPNVNSVLFSQPVENSAARYYKIERLPNP